MNNHTTIEKMRHLRLHGMAQVHYAAVHDKMYADYTQDEYAALLVDQYPPDQLHLSKESLIPVLA